MSLCCVPIKRLNVPNNYNTIYQQLVCVIYYGCLF
jgi:hypothetical protein